MKIKTTMIVTASIFGLLYSGVSLSKGTSEIPPPAEQTQAKETTNIPVTPSAVDGILRISTSFGPASLTVDSDNYTVGGATDLAIEFRFTENALGAKAMWASFRYLPFASAVELSGKEYTGVMNGLFLGVTSDYALPSESWLAYASLEVGGFGPDFGDDFDLTDSSAPKDFTAGLLVSGGANYVIGEKFSIGPKLALGFGAFNSYALTANAVFTF